MDAASSSPSLVLDALVGYSLSRPADGRLAEAISYASSVSSPVISLDVPTGIDATTGEWSGPRITPDLTMTLALPKTGLARENGRLLLADIGIPAQVFTDSGVRYHSPFQDSFIVELRRDQ